MVSANNLTVPRHWILMISYSDITTCETIPRLSWCIGGNLIERSDSYNQWNAIEKKKTISSPIRTNKFANAVNYLYICFHTWSKPCN